MTQTKFETSSENVKDGAIACSSPLQICCFVEEIIACFDDSVNLSHTKFLPVFSKVDEILNMVTMTIGRRYNVFHG